MRKIRVLIVDDSPSVRQALTQILENDPGIEVMATAADPLIAAQRLRDEVPDVITLDVEMPRMDGLTFLDKIMSQHPIPVVICSSLTDAGSQMVMTALEKGAVDVITKPKHEAAKFLRESAIRICDAVRAAAQVQLNKRALPIAAPPKLSADAILSRAKTNTQIRRTEKVIAIGASTGGTEALSVLLRALPESTPGIVIVQHMPERFTTYLANRLNSMCALRVSEAQHGQPLESGHALIAPGSHHLLLKRGRSRYYVELRDGPLVNRHRPSVDVLFRSTARYAGANAIGVILTGMGDDGARGMLEMKQAGAFNIAQDEESCVVFGMPNSALREGGVDTVLPLGQIADELTRRG